MKTSLDKKEEMQVLMVTMDLKNVEELLEKSNIQTSFVIGNQCEKDERRVIGWRDQKGILVSREERGVGNNRNETLKYSNCDICILADDDMRFHDGYEKIVKKAFEEHSDADIIIFNIDEKNKSGRRINSKSKIIHIWNYMNYGAARIAFRKKSIAYYGITFNTLFGGGTPHSAGEDSLFLHDCLRYGLRIVAVPYSIAELSDNRESTWFSGYTDKYFFDKGVFIAIAHPKLVTMLALLFSIKDYKVSKEESIQKIFKEIMKGVAYVKGRFK